MLDFKIKCKISTLGRSKLIRVEDIEDTMSTKTDSFTIKSTVTEMMPVPARGGNTKPKTELNVLSVGLLASILAVVVVLVTIIIIISALYRRGSLNRQHDRLVHHTRAYTKSKSRREFPDIVESDSKF